MTDTLLNVFLAIAVDNLANAQELTKVRVCAADLAIMTIVFAQLSVMNMCHIQLVKKMPDYFVFTRMKRRKRSSSTRDMPEAGTASYLSKSVFIDNKNFLVLDVRSVLKLASPATDSQTTLLRHSGGCCVGKLMTVLNINTIRPLKTISTKSCTVDSENQFPQLHGECS